MTTGGTMKVDATCCDAEVRYPTDYNLLEDGSELIDRLLDKFCARHKAEKPRTHRVEARQAFISLTKKKRKGKKLVDKVRLIQLRCLQADLLTFLDFLGGQSSRLLSCFSRHDCKCLKTFRLTPERPCPNRDGSPPKSGCLNPTFRCKEIFHSIVKSTKKTEGDKPIIMDIATYLYRLYSFEEAFVFIIQDFPNAIFATSSFYDMRVVFYNICSIR